MIPPCSRLVLPTSLCLLFPENTRHVCIVTIVQRTTLKGRRVYHLAQLTYVLVMSTREISERKYSHPPLKPGMFLDMPSYLSTRLMPLSLNSAPILVGEVGFMPVFTNVTVPRQLQTRSNACTRQLVPG